MSTTTKIAAAAQQLFDAAESGIPCAPVRNLIGLDLESAYAVQDVNTQKYIEAGRRLVGKKIGLTSQSVQEQLGVGQPDFGSLFSDMEYFDGAHIPLRSVSQPKAEAEVAFILGVGLDSPSVTPSEVVSAIRFVVPAIEIVGSRIQDWDIKISDTVADNASAGLYVLGGPARSLNGLDLAGVAMTMYRNGQAVSYGAGNACLGNPINAVLWLARTCANLGSPLRAGDVILSGALGPMVGMSAGDTIETRISGLGSVRVSIDSN